MLANTSSVKQLFCAFLEFRCSVEFVQHTARLRNVIVTVIADAATIAVHVIIKHQWIDDDGTTIT